MGGKLLMMFEIKKNYDSNNLVNFLDGLTDSQHEKFWGFFSGFRIYAEVDGNEIVVRKKSTQIYHFALIEKKLVGRYLQWVGVSCSRDQKYLSGQVKEYYSQSIVKILPVRVGLIVKRSFRKLTKVCIGE